MRRAVIDSSLGLFGVLVLAACGADAGSNTGNQQSPVAGSGSSFTPIVGGTGASVAVAGMIAPTPVQGPPVRTQPAAGTAAPAPGPVAGVAAPPTNTVPMTTPNRPPAAGSGMVAMPPITATAGTGAMPPAAGTGAAPIPTATGGTDPKIPAVNGECPKIATGPAMFMGVTIQLTVGNKSETAKGPIMIYWHGTGGSALTAPAEVGSMVVNEIMASGGVLASMESGGKGNPVDWGVFTFGDFEIVDQIVACSVQQLNIDTRRIYTGGASAGGLAAGTLALARSTYVAAANPNSGGVAPWPGNTALQDPMHPPAALTMHGAMGVDMVVIDFGTSSMDMDRAIVAKGGFAVDCNHGGGHVAAPPDLKAAGWEFMKAHPFGTKPSPYESGLPASFPKYCMIVK